MKIGELYKKGFVVSLEIFPPKNGETLDSIMETLFELTASTKGMPKQYLPQYVSVTESKVANARGGTLQIAITLGKIFNIESMAHLICAGKTSQELENKLVEIKYAGLDNILALRGDKPAGSNKFYAKKGGYRYASQLIEQISNMNKGKYLNGEGINTDFGIAVAAYPETHPDAKSPIHDLQNLKHKLEKADFAITQLFFDMEKYESFIENAAKIGIIKPIVPGIMVLETYSQLARFEKMNISVPLNMKNEIERFKEDARVVKEIGSSYAAKNCSQLMKYAPGLHFYTMNRHAHVRDVFRKIF